MYYKKNKSILRSIRNNNNNKTYYVLAVLMLAAICIIAASIILRGYDGGHDDNMYDSSAASVQPTDVPKESETRLADSGSYVVYILVKEGVTVLCRMDSEGNIVEIVSAAKCSIGDDVRAYIKDGGELLLSKLSVVPTKAIWKEYEYDSSAYYVQYYSMINGIEFHSSLYTDNGDYNSIVKASYDAIYGYNGESNERDESEGGTQEVVRGVTMSVASAHWFYENVPSNTDIYVCEELSLSSLNKAEIMSGNPDNIINESVSNSSDGRYLQNGTLPVIPYGFHCDPTDTEANYVFSPYRLGSINNVANKTVEMGQIVYSFIEEGSSLVGIIFNNVTLTAEDGTDISQYLISQADVSMYVDAQIAAMNVNGFLLPGDYVVRFCAADVYGTTLESSCYLSVVDTTAPVIMLSREITEINRAQIESSEYILGMVTVTDLCKLTDDGVTYSLTEDGEDVHITFSATDVYGNTGTLELDLKRVD